MKETSVERTKRIFEAAIDMYIVHIKANMILKEVMSVGLDNLTEERAKEIVRVANQWEKEILEKKP